MKYRLIYAFIAVLRFMPRFIVGATLRAISPSFRALLWEKSAMLECIEDILLSR